MGHVVIQTQRLSLWFSGVFFTLHGKRTCFLSRFFGDSKAIIDWAKVKHTLHNLELQHWANQTRDIINNFHSITFSHIFRELNIESDHLSELALKEDIVNIVWELFQEGTYIEHGFLSIA